MKAKTMKPMKKMTPAEHKREEKKEMKKGKC